MRGGAEGETLQADSPWSWEPQAGRAQAGLDLTDQE